MNGRQRRGLPVTVPRLTRSRRGSLAIFFCIVLAGLVLVMGSWLQAARVRAAEAELARAMSAQIDVSLASYSRDLYSQFGLFAFDGSTLDKTVFRNSLSAGLHGCPLVLDYRDLVTDRTVLDGQIVRHMKARLPGAWFDLFIARMAGFSGLLPSLIPAAGGSLTETAITETATAAAMPSGAAASVTIALPAAAALSGQHIGSLEDLLKEAFQDLAAAAVRKVASRLFDKLMEELQDDLLGEVRRQYQSFSAERLSVSQSSPVEAILGSMPDFFNPGNLASVAGAIDSLLNFSTAPVYEKLCVVEYIMAYCPARATVQIVDGTGSDLETPDGRSLASLAAGRPGEIEQILTGIDQPALAAGTVRFILISLRSLINLAAILTDSTRMAAIRSAAATLVGAVAAISLGTVIIEPESVAYLIAAAQALAAGISDSSRLVAGHGVRFWPGKGNITFQLWYGDYMRLMLYCLPRATLVERCGRLLDRLYPDQLHTGLTVRTSYAGRTYALDGGYD
jgi:hypothetical protein